MRRRGWALATFRCRSSGVMVAFGKRLPFAKLALRNCFAIVFCGSLSGRRSTITGDRHSNIRRSPYVSHSLPIPVRPLRRRMGPVGAASRILREAWSSAEVVRPAHCRCRLLSSALGLCLADASPRVPYSRQTDYYHFRKWRGDGRLRQAHDRLRAAVREAEGRTSDLSGAILDSQAVKSTGV
jgi:hypothetical protein